MTFNNNKLPILVYHQIVPDEFSVESFPLGDQPYFSRFSEYYSHINYLTENNFITLTVGEINKLEQKHPSSKKVVLTFDDGQISDYDVVFPFLVERRMKATFYIITDLVGKEGYVTWENLREMQKYGMEIGSHSCSHRCFLDLSKEEIQTEMLKSREILEHKLGCQIRSFSIPFGFGNRCIVDLAFATGYQAVCTSDVKLSRLNAYPPVYGRIGLRRGDDVCKFKGIVEMEWQIVGKMIVEDKMKSTLKRVFGRGLWLRLRNIALSQRKT